ncbi:site-specific integrase [Pararhodobacter marinus]|nr:tyrosine-type recombinase/integrase [Pararhodobacter marinus]
MVDDMRLKYVTTERLPSGATRYRFRRNGKVTTLRGEPGSREFHEHYAALIDGVPVVPMKAVRGSVEWLVGLFLEDLERKVAARLASPLTLKGKRHHLGRLVEEYGPKSAEMPRSAVIKLADKYAATPGAADNLIKGISGLYIWAIQREYVQCDNPARGVKRMTRKTKGFAPWTAEDIAQFLAFHAPGTTARRTLMLAACTTARRGDLCQIGRQHEVTRGGRKWLRWEQNKAPHEIVEMPMSRALLADLAGHGNMTYILTSYGAPYSAAGLGNAFRKWADDAGLKGRSLHGVRKGVAAMLTASGATSAEIDVLLGHEMGSPETKVYVRSAARAGLAETVVDRIDAMLG